jgi:cellulose/xylan binding protein with CBM9 domain
MMSSSRAALMIVFGLSSIFVGASSQSPSPLRPHPLGYLAYRAAGSVQIDGQLNDAAWRQAPWSESFVDIEGAVKPRPTWPTRVKMIWDDAFFYVGAELVEPHIWATQTQHDSVIFHENDFEVFLEPDGDNRAYYEFEINALGTYWDLFLPKPYRDGGKAVDSWEIPGLKSAVRLDGTLNDSRDTDRSWSVELAFPWSVLKAQTQRPAPPRDGDQWRINFSRVEWDLEPAPTGYTKIAGRAEHNWVWSPQGAIDMHRPEMWGYVQFSTQTSGSLPFIPDSSWPARAWLYDVYYTQRAFKQAHGRYAVTLAELGTAVPATDGLGPAELTSEAGDRYTVRVVLTRDGVRTAWFTNHESAIWASVLQ